MQAKASIQESKSKDSVEEIFSLGYFVKNVG